MGFGMVAALAFIAAAWIGAMMMWAWPFTRPAYQITATGIAVRSFAMVGIMIGAVWVPGIWL